MKNIDHLLRVAIWKAHGRRCAYSGDPIRFSDLEIDHIIPAHLKKTPTKLRHVLDALQLPSDFDLDGVENLLPSSGHSNRQKGSSPTDLRTAHALELARAKVHQVEKIRKQLDQEDQVALARLQLSFAIEQGAVTYSEIQKLISEIESNPRVVQLHHPLNFANGEQISALAPLDGKSILDKPISPRPHGLRALALISPTSATREVHTAREWLVARRDGFYPRSNYDLKEEAFFLHVAVVAWAIQRKLPYDLTFVVGEGVGSLDMLPPLLLPHLSGDESQHLRQLQSDGETVGSILEAHKVVPDRGPNLLCFEYEGMHQTMLEIMRGSFTGDGHEEILVQQYERALTGTYAGVRFVILQRVQPSGPFHFIELSASALSSLL